MQKTYWRGRFTEMCQDKWHQSWKFWSNSVTTQTSQKIRVRLNFLTACLGKTRSPVQSAALEASERFNSPCIQGRGAGSPAPVWTLRPSGNLKLRRFALPFWTPATSFPWGFVQVGHESISQATCLSPALRFPWLAPGCAAADPATWCSAHPGQMKHQHPCRPAISHLLVVCGSCFISSEDNFEAQGKWGWPLASCTLI